MRTRLLTTTLLVTAMLPLAGTLAFAQEAAAPALTPASETAPAPEAAPAAAPAPSPEVAPTPEAAPADAPAAAADAGAQPKGKDTLSVDFPDEDIRSILRNVADLFELNLVIPDTLQGKTTIKLRDVTWRQIFQVVLQPVGYTFVEEGNIIKVVTQESLNLEPLATEVFILNYAKASDVKPSLDSLVDAKVGGKIVVDTRSNALVVTERPSAFQRIRPIILTLDKATEQVMIESKFIEVTNADVKNVGVNWTTLSGYNVGAAPTDLLVRGGHAIPRDGNGALATGDYGKGNGAQGASTMFSAVMSAGQFNTVISALTTGDDSKLVSNPTLVTLNNTEASINIGEEYPIPNYTYNQEQGSFEISGFTYKPIGILLKVTPQINSQGFIRLSLEPELSSRMNTVSFGGGGGAPAEIPIINVKKTRTQITIKDGFTLGIGGLVENTSRKGTSKVPVLGNIPGLGRLFSSKTATDSGRNLLIFITARTLNPEGAQIGEVFDPRVTRKMQLTKDDLPGQRDGSDPFYTPPPPPEPKKKSWFSKE